MKKVILLLIFSFFLFGCSVNESIHNNSINIEEIKNIMLNSEYVIIDVRTKEEYNVGHLVDAINIPYDEISKIEIDKKKIVFVYCKSGNRSNIAYESLKKLGYTVYDLGAFDNIDLPRE